MMQKLVSVDDRAVLAAHEKRWGGYNDFPPDWRGVDLQYVAQRSHFSNYSPEVIEFRQMFYPREMRKPCCSAHLYFYWDGTGLGIEVDYWGKTVHYYAFGCEHDYHELSMAECSRRGIYHAGRCWHVSECSKCKHINAVDSSD